MTNFKRCFFITVIYIGLIVSCKKNGAPTPIPIPTPPIATIKVDTQYLAGWWYPVNPGIDVKDRYFGSDHLYFFDATNLGGVTYTGSWSWGKNDTLIAVGAMGGKVPVQRLTKDSLTILGTYKYYKVNLPAIPSNTISTVAGNGQNASTWLSGSSHGDGGPATAAMLGEPEDVITDALGNIYIADAGTHSIRKVTVATGIITTVAGSGIQGFKGDGGPATQACLNYPAGIALDAAGNLYISDFGNSRIRKVTASTGIITTIAGSNATGFTGDGGLASAATIWEPTKIVIDNAGNIYFNDQQDWRIRKINASDGKISTIAGNGVYAYSGDGGLATSAALRPTGIALDASGNIFISEPGAIRKVNLSTGIISTIAGNGTAGFAGDGGLASAAKLHGPSGIMFNKNGDLYVADSGNNRVRVIYATDGTINTIAGSGVASWTGNGAHATLFGINSPEAVAFDPYGNIYVADWGSNMIRKVTK